MNSIRAAFTEIPDPGAVQTVADGLLWLRMPLPFALDHINLYLIDDGDGWVAVDSGLMHADTRSHWQRVIAENLDGRPLKALLVTHYHPDHLGAAGWLCREYGIPLWMTEPEYRTAQALLQRDKNDDAAAFYRRLGMQDSQVESMFESAGMMASGYAPLPPVSRILKEGDRLRIGIGEWQLRVTGGHSPAHAVLYSESLGVMISGDQVLPRISSNVGIYPERVGADPLGCWLHSLERLEHWPDDTLVLPSHNEPFYGLHRRLNELAEDHAGKLEQLTGFCAEPSTAMALVPRLYTRPLGKVDLMLAVGECLAHLEYLVIRDRLERRTGADGCWYYAAPSRSGAS